MKYSHLLILTVLFVLFISSCANTDVAKKVSATDSVPVRKITKWDTAQKFYLDEYHLLLGVASDDTNLYVRLVTTEENVKNSINRSGCTVWIDTASGKTKNYGFHYPAGNHFEGAEPPQQHNGRGPTSRSNGESEENFQTLEILSDAGENIESIAVHKARSFGIDVSIKTTTGYLLWDLTVPLSEVKAHNNTKSSVFPETVNIGLEIKEIVMIKAEGMDNERSERGGPPGGGGSGGGMGGGSGGGGMRGGGMGGGSNKPGQDVSRENPSPQSRESVERWFTINLSKTPLREK